MPLPHFELDCDKTNDAPAMVHANLPRATIVCPANCTSGARSVYGGDDGVYHRDSSICRAAIHAGALNDTGGEVTLYLQPLLRSWNGYYEGWCLHNGALAPVTAVWGQSPRPRPYHCIALHPSPPLEPCRLGGPRH